jgi:photosynthetic reaction center cytochrome c subunit
MGARASTMKSSNGTVGKPWRAIASGLGSIAGALLLLTCFSFRSKLLRTTALADQGSLTNASYAVPVLALSAIREAQSAQPSTTIPSPRTTEQVYKNIQVLKGVPADQLIPAMQFIAASLGVQCDFCHLENAFDKDDKETKRTARKMMRMMFAINKENFDGHKEVTCYACHRGAHKPVATPVISEEPVQLALEEKKNDEEGNGGSLPSADKIVERYLQAMGGADAAARISTRVQKGTLTVGIAQFPVEVLTKRPANRVTTVRFPNGESVTGFNAQVGWLSTPGHGFHEMSSAEVDASRMDAYPQFAIDLSQTFRELRVQQQETVDGRPTYVVSGIREKSPPVQLYFDQESGLLIRLLRYVDTPLGLNPTQIDYADYRQEGGVRTPFRWTVVRPGGRFTIQIDQMQQNVPIDDEKFVKPAAPVQPDH